MFLPEFTNIYSCLFAGTDKESLRIFGRLHVMAARKLKFLQGVAKEYHKKCPELSRIMMVKHFDDRLTNMKDSEENYQSTLNVCGHCGSLFTGRNCTFRIKPKRKCRRRKKHNVQNNPAYGIMPKSSNFLQILCHVCGWKTRQVGATRKPSKIKSVFLENDTLLRNNNALLGQTPRSSKKASITSQSTPQQGKTCNGQHSSGKRKKTKSRLRELLAKEKLESEQKTSSPSLINFLANI